MNLQQILLAAVNAKASDLHITVGVPCILRVHGQLQYIDDRKVTMEDAEKLIRELTNDFQWKTLINKGEVDFSYTLPGIQRFRVNAYRQRNAFAVALRLINTEIPKIEDLGLPAIVKELSNKIAVLY